MDSTERAIRAVKGQALRDLAADFEAEFDRFVETGRGRTEFGGDRLLNYLITRAEAIELGEDTPSLSIY